ncbi:hypothetical protein DFR86_07545 [Acidianus sulfidivorans JP7]|uniref:Uncharacterized protein n=1 Tax=Acidianus sulfidivorans JP7 TaxID=619593 RepID=A0A2U9IN33_9CREN|nr:hypothetical protein [Acidianus sulfidivorans]AWR97416.1 hypothetical protein DFR86_07545 [Acidianus sulfidivorans JP7]
MKAYDVLSYFVEHADNGSIIALTTENNIPILVIKNDNYSFISYICYNGEVKSISKNFDQTTFHRAILDFIDEISVYLGADIKELKISDAALFTDCIPKKEEKPKRNMEKRKKELKKEEESITEKIQELKKLEKPFHIVPLLSDQGKLIAYVPEISSVNSFDFITKYVSLVDNDIKSVSIDFKQLYLTLFTNKLDPHQGNPFTTVNDITFFTASFIDLGNKGQGEFNNKKINKKSGRFFIGTYKGGLKTEDLEFLDFSESNKGRLYVGLFVRKGEQILKISSMSVVDLHDSGKITLNSYLFSSFAQSAKNDIVNFADYDRLFSNYLNLALAKSDGRSILKDAIEIHSMMIDLPFSEQIENNQIKVVDPISFWYYSSNNEDIKECVDCPLKDKVKLRKDIINILKKKGWMNAFLV